MARKAYSALAVAAAFLVMGKALAVPNNGVLSGLSATWAVANRITIEPGEGYANGFLYLGNDVGYQPLAPENVQAEVVPTPNTPYYVYACFDAALVPPRFTNHPVTSNISPIDNGTGFGIVTGADAGNTSCDGGLFLGSIVTDSTGTWNTGLVPFYRTGEDVVLSLVNAQGANACPAVGAGTPIWHQGGGAVPLNFTHTGPTCQLVAFDSIGTNSCNNKDNNGNFLDLPMPRSASDMLIDSDLVNIDSSAHYLDVPYATPNPTPAVYLSNYQLNLFAPLNPNPTLMSNFTDYYTHTRVNPTYDAGVNTGHLPPAPGTTAQFNVCIDSAPAATSGTVTGYAIYRGYVESIGHLTQE